MQGTAMRMVLGLWLYLAGPGSLGSVWAAEDYSTWAHAAKIKFNTTPTGANITAAMQIPVLVRLSASDPGQAAIFSQSLSTGADLRFADPDGTPLDFQIERWDPQAGKAEIWILVPQVDVNSWADYIKVHWGKPEAGWVSDGSKTFSGGNRFSGVWHLGEGGSQARANSVGNGNHAAPFNYDGDEKREGVIGMADSLDGAATGDYLDLGSGFEDFSKGITYTIWAYCAGAGNYEQFLYIGNEFGNDNIALIRSGTSNNLAVSVYNGGWVNAVLEAPNVLEPGKWIQLGFTISANGEGVKNALKIFKNGAKVAEGELPQPIPYMARSKTTIGSSPWPGFAYFKGMIDEPQLSNTLRSPERMKLDYEFQRPDGKLISWEYEPVNAPPAPVAEPQAGTYFGSVSVQLTCDADNSSIFYTLDGSEPDTLVKGSTLLAGARIPVDKDMVLKAKAYRAGKAGLVLTAAYIIHGAPRSEGDSLAPGGSIHFDPTHSISYPSQETQASVMVSLGSAWNPPPAGFDGLGPLFTVSPKDASAVFPGLMIKADSGAEAGVQLYRREDGVNRWMPPNDGMLWVSSAGSYFWGRDIQPPRIRFAGSDPIGADSVQVVFAIEDNVANLRCRLHVYGESGGGADWRSVSSGEIIPFRLRLPDGPGFPLELGMDATDESGLSQYPSGAGRRYSLERNLASISAPVSLLSGVHWKLVGMPMIPKTPLTVVDLASESGSGKLVSVYWRTKSGAEGDYEWYGAKDALPAGKAFWLAAEKAAPNLIFPPSKSIPSDSDGLFPIPLKGGWNLVTCPSFRALAWPVSNKDGESYLRSPLKGLRGFDGTGYTHADSLRPWEGYYVWYEGGDTVVRVGPGLARAGESAKRGAGIESAYGGAPPSTGGLHLAFRDGSERLELGAAGYARKGLGIEDERLPPSLSRETGTWLVREGRRLSTDYVAWNPEAVLSWTVAAQGKPQGYPSGNRLRLETADLPEGHQAWAVSPARGMKYRLLPGADIPLAGDDTLFIHAGTPEALAKLGDLIRGREAAGDFACALRSAAGGLELRVNLPSAARLDVRVWTANGSEAGGLKGIFAAAGSHTWNWPALAPGLSAPARGVYLLEIKVDGVGWSAHRVEKFSAL
jgi:concanavalin A-like lectin/glucanase superfamily protein/uncharacterized protein DUF2341/chitobiase/beta-hexosaminidase-like protein